MEWRENWMHGNDYEDDCQIKKKNNKTNHVHAFRFYALYFFQFICSAPMNYRLKFFVSLNCSICIGIFSRCPAGLSIGSKHKQQQQKLHARTKRNRKVKFSYVNFAWKYLNLVCMDKNMCMMKRICVCVRACMHVIGPTSVSIQLNMIFRILFQIKMANIFWLFYVSDLSRFRLNHLTLKSILISS